ncbi:MAG: DUF4175 family protein [Armatimonadota bacterium]
MSARAQLMSALRPYLLGRRMLAAGAGLLQGGALAAGMLALVLLVAGRGVLGEPRVTAAMLAALLLPALLHLLRPVDPLTASLSIERTFPFLQDRVATAAHLVSGRTGRAPRSERMISRITSEATAALRDLPLRRALPAGQLRLPAAALAVALVLVACAWAAAPPPAAQPPAPAPAIVASPGTAPQAHPTRLHDITLSVAPPSHTGLPCRQLTSALDEISAPAGSEITISGRCEPREAEVTVALDPGGAQVLSADGRAFSHSFRLREPVRWRLLAEAPDERVESPWRRIEVTPDGAPSVRLVRPEGDLTLDRAESIEVAAVATDDFGVTALGLRHRLAGEDRWRSLPLKIQPGTGVSAAARLNLAAVGLKPGEELILRAWATDNDVVSGPKTSLSAPVRIRLRETAPGEREPRTPLEEAQEQEADAMEQLRRAAEDLERELTRAVERAQGGPGSEAGAPQVGRELQEAARRLQEQAGRLQRAMREAQRQLQADELMTPDLVEKVRELHELMQQVLDEEMRRALEELEEALKAQDLDEIRMSLEQARQAQQRFLERLDQTLSLLRRARMEGLLERLRRLAEELAARQQELSRRTSELSQADGDARATERSQRLLARDTEPLAAKVEGAVEQARELSDEVAAKLGAVADRLVREDPAGQMRRAASALSRGSPRDAAGPQQEAEASLRRAAGALSELEEQVKSEATEDARRQIAAMLRDALALSEQQEDVGEDVRRLSGLRRADLMRDKRPIDPVRRRQSRLAEATRRLAERMAQLAGQTPAMDPHLAAGTELIAEQMAQAAREIEGADLAAARQRGRDAMAGLNEVARRLLEVQDQLRQSSAQMALSQWMQRLQSLAQRQQGLNRQTGQAQQSGQSESGRPQAQPGGMSPSQLAFEQALIRAALEQMLKRGGRGTQPMADQLGGVPDEMEKVEGELRSGRIERKTVERQERILEKMLEAQRSLYTKQQERSERKAERPGEWEPPPSPPALSPSLMRAPSVSVQSGGGAGELPRGYEEMVREYFRALGEGSP